MTREEFMDLGADVFADYLPKTKSSDRKQFLDAMYEELVARSALESAAVETDTDVEGLFDSYGDD